MSKPIRVALLGCGTVGTEVVRLMTEQADDLEARVGAPLELVGIAVRRPERHPDVPQELLTTDAQALLAIVADRGLAGLILGLPRNMDGSEGPRAQSTRAFARNLRNLTDLPIGYWDERLSTVAAERALLEADTSRARRAQVIDQVAAGYILQGALDRLRHLGRA